MVDIRYGNDMTPIISRNKYLTEKLLVLDGLTGTGKTMMSALLESYNRVEVGRFIYDIEYISISEMLGAQRRDATKAILGLVIDSKLYDNMISREVNFRPSDLSSVFKNWRAFNYIQRLFKADGDAVIDRLNQQKPIMMINTHQLLAAMDSLFEQFNENVFVVEMERHPLYLLEHWLSYMDMHGVSARDFTIWVEDSKKNSVPWFAHSWRDEYWSLTKFDRVVKSIDSLVDLMDDQYAKQPASQLMVVPFEDFTLNTGRYVEEISTWLGTEATSQTKKACKKQNLPRTNINAGLNKKIYQRYGYSKNDQLQSHVENYKAKLTFANKHKTSVSGPILDKLIERYESQHGLWF